MMTKISTIILIAAVALSSCSKYSDTDTPQPQPSEKYRQVTIKAGSAQTKTYVDAGTLKWSDKDKLNIVDQEGKTSAAALDLKSGKDSASGTFEGQVDASITDATDLYGWCGGDWTYSSGSFSVNMPATQTYVDNGLAENAYPSIGTGTITSGITLSNPMGVLKLSVKGATASDAVKSITVTSAANNLTGSFTVNPASSYAVSGGSSKTVTLNVASPYAALSLTDAVNFYIVLPPAEYAASDLTVKITFSDDSYLNTIFTDAVTVTAGSATAKEISDHTSRRGTLSGQEWMMIKGSDGKHLKWATQNLAVTTSGQAKWCGTNYQIGDYFQWAASYDGYGITAEASKVPANLVLYTSFTNSGSSGSFDGLTDSKQFNKASAPYGGGSYTKYTSGSAILEPSDDVANIVLGDTWRMPTGGNAGEFKAMRAVTYWAWDATDKGYYVFKPGVGTSGAANGRGNITVTDDKTKALLFFPAAGNGYCNGLDFAGENGLYFASTLYSSNTNFAYILFFDFSNVDPNIGNEREYGFSVRPVSD